MGTKNGRERRRNVSKKENDEGEKSHETESQNFFEDEDKEIDSQNGDPAIGPPQNTYPRPFRSPRIIIQPPNDLQNFVPQQVPLSRSRNASRLENMSINLGSLLEDEENDSDSELDSLPFIDGFNLVDTATEDTQHEEQQKLESDLENLSMLEQMVMEDSEAITKRENVKFEVKHVEEKNEPRRGPLPGSARKPIEMKSREAEEREEADTVQDLFERHHLFFSRITPPTGCTLGGEPAFVQIQPRIPTKCEKSKKREVEMEMEMEKQKSSFGDLDLSRVMQYINPRRNRIRAQVVFGTSYVPVRGIDFEDGIFYLRCKTPRHDPMEVDVHVLFPRYEVKKGGRRITFSFIERHSEELDKWRKNIVDSKPKDLPGLGFFGYPTHCMKGEESSDEGDRSHGDGGVPPEMYEAMKIQWQMEEILGDSDPLLKCCRLLTEVFEEPSDVIRQNLSSYNIMLDFDVDQHTAILESIKQASEIRDPCGFTLLMRFAVLDAGNFVRFMLDNGYGHQHPEEEEDVDNFGNSAYDWAKFFKLDEMCQLLRPKEISAVNIWPYMMANEQNKRGQRMISQQQPSSEENQAILARLEEMMMRGSSSSVGNRNNDSGTVVEKKPGTPPAKNFAKNVVNEEEEEEEDNVLHRINFYNPAKLSQHQNDLYGDLARYRFGTQNDEWKGYNKKDLLKDLSFYRERKCIVKAKYSADDTAERMEGSFTPRSSFDEGSYPLNYNNTDRSGSF